MRKIWITFFLITFIILAALSELYSQASPGAIFVAGVMFGVGGSVIYDMARFVDEN